METHKQHFGEYEVIRHIGTGGMAALFLCRKTGAGGFDRRLVVKVLLEEFLNNDSFVDMFRDEARLAAQLDHPNVVQAVDVGSVGKFPYLAMDYVHGPNFNRLARQAWKQGIIDRPAMAFIMAEACRGMHYAHELTNHEGEPLNVIHRDVSPGNIMVSEQGWVKLIDFGVASGEDRATKTEAGTLKGKLQFMAPEQLMNEGYDRRVDVYAAGVSLYLTTTNTRPFGKESGTTWTKRLSGHVGPPSSRTADYPPELERIVLKAMALEPEDRYQSALEMAHDLASYANQHNADATRVRTWVSNVFPDGPAAWYDSSKPKSSTLISAATFCDSPQAQPEKAQAQPEKAQAQPEKAGPKATRKLAILAILTLLVIPLGLAMTVGVVYLYPGSNGETQGTDESFEEYLTEAEALGKQQKYQAALDLINHAREDRANDPSLNIRATHLADEFQNAMQLAQGRQALKADNLEQAQSAVRAVLGRSPQHSEALTLLKEINQRAHDSTTSTEASSPNEPTPNHTNPVVPTEPTPAPIDPAPQPEPVETEPVKPTPSLLDPAEPVPNPPEPTEPTPSPPEPTEPAPSQPEPTEPAPSQPAPIEPTPSQPAPAVPAPSQPAPVVPAPVEPAPPTRTATIQLQNPSLPRSVQVRTVGEVALVCSQVEKALLKGAVPKKIARGSTSALLNSIDAHFSPGQMITLHPRGMYAFVASKAAEEARPGAIRTGLLRAHEQGRLK